MAGSVDVISEWSVDAVLKSTQQPRIKSSDVLQAIRFEMYFHALAVRQHVGEQLEIEAHRLLIFQRHSPG